MIQCVIFDFDGTLVDSEVLSNQAFLDLIPSINVSVEEMVKNYSGRKLAWIFSDIEKQFNCKLSPTIEKDYRNRVAELFDTQLRAFDGVHHALDEISLPVCIATSAPVSKVEPALKKTNLSEYFETNIFSSYDIGSWKPEPDIFLYASQCMKVAPQNCLVVEDSPAGVEAANAAGMSAVQFCGSRQPFHSNFIHSYDQLGQWISNL
ncbi:MAG: HAD-IA family hydrolase [Gammaproteobacteria bacterium]|nr:HAD-IA family hydrolase [Gammaproteobacteria bacterium]